MRLRSSVIWRFTGFDKRGQARLRVGGDSKIGCDVALLILVVTFMSRSFAVMVTIFASRIGDGLRGSIDLALDGIHGAPQSQASRPTIRSASRMVCPLRSVRLSGWRVGKFIRPLPSMTGAWSVFSELNQKGDSGGRAGTAVGHKDRVFSSDEKAREFGNRTGIPGGRSCERRL